MTVQLDERAIEQKIQGRVNIAQALVDQRVIKDSNLFAPEDVGTLQDSALLSSDIGSGVIEWGVPYARRQYYEAPNKSKDKNPRAQMKWFEAAKALYKGEWIKEGQDGYNR